jgi:HD-GYP domain-containing protein (c-di-GMP phosphodiesterase class II)
MQPVFVERILPPATLSNITVAPRFGVGQSGWAGGGRSRASVRGVIGPGPDLRFQTCSVAVVTAQEGFRNIPRLLSGAGGGLIGLSGVRKTMRSQQGLRRPAISYVFIVATLNPISVGTSDSVRSLWTRESRSLHIFIQVCHAIGTIRDRRELMIAIMEQVTAALDAERSTLYLHDPKRQELWTLVAQGLDDCGELRVPDDQGQCGSVFQSHKAMCIPDVLKDPCFARRFVERTGYQPRSMLAVPLMSRSGRCEGVLQAMDRRIGHFDEGDLVLLEAIGVQVAICLENASLYEAQKRQFESFVRALSTALDARDPLTAIHSVNVANYAMGIGEISGLDPRDLNRLRIAGLVHDIGKIGIPEALLTKPGRLSPDEYAEMKRHAEHSRRILSQIEFTDDLAGVDVIAAAHHERPDGAGYPNGLSGENVPLLARILAVADVFDALTQTRHYRRSLSVAEAFQIIDEMVPAAMDARCVKALKAFLGHES